MHTHIHTHIYSRYILTPTAIADPAAPRPVILLPKTSTVARMMQTRLTVFAMEWVMGETCEGRCE